MDKTMKLKICTLIGMIGSALAALFGGWDSSLVTLVILMSADYITGLIVAGVFHTSKKTDTGTLESRAGWKGLCRKGMTLLFVLIAYRLDLVIGVNYIRQAVIIGFIANEVISLVENAGLMGVPLPAVITKAIDILTKQAEKAGGSGD
nr:MAG TPA: holin [Caudoviricetes sp.]